MWSTSTWWVKYNFPTSRWQYAGRKAERSEKVFFSICRKKKKWAKSSFRSLPFLLCRLFLKEPEMKKKRCRQTVNGFFPLSLLPFLSLILFSKRKFSLLHSAQHCWNLIAIWIEANVECTQLARAGFRSHSFPILPISLSLVLHFFHFQCRLLITEWKLNVHERRVMVPAACCPCPFRCLHKLRFTSRFHNCVIQLY